MGEEDWMRLAIETARRGIACGQTPFGACIVQADRLVVASHNQVWASEDITAHAEIVAIRAACRTLGTIDLSDCVIYSTCEPCPMCFSACHWANLQRVVYGAGIEEAKESGFRELTIGNDEMKRLGGSRIEIRGGVLQAEAVELFGQWLQMPGHKRY